MSGSTGLRRFVPNAPAARPEPAESPTAQQELAQATAAVQAPAQATTAVQATATVQAPAQITAAQQEPAVASAARLPGPAPGGRSPSEKCELCGTEVPADHGHVADLERSSLVCACRACYLLFTHSQAGRGRYRAIPDRYLYDPAHPLTVAEWDSLEIPVGLSFFLRSSPDGAVTGFYPSPAGATECRLDLAVWDQLAESHPLLGATALDVEAALISRADVGVEYFLVPIDACYELAGRMRLHWRGFDGGAEARESIAEFLAGVRARARTFDQES